jgi:hypothetical protein
MVVTPSLEHPDTLAEWVDLLILEAVALAELATPRRMLVKQAGFTVVVVAEECDPQQTPPVALAVPESSSSPYSHNPHKATSSTTLRVRWLRVRGCVPILLVVAERLR